MGLNHLAFDADASNWVQILFVWTGLTLLIGVSVLSLSARTRFDSLYLVLGVGVILLGMQWIIALDGYTRLLVAPQAVVWTLLVIHFRRRLSIGSIGGPQRVAIWALLLTFVVNLGMDYADLVKYAQGDTELPAYVANTENLSAALPYADPVPVLPATYY